MYKKYELIDLLRFVERQIVFTIESTKDVKNYMDFMDSMQATILFNSTCMCLQSIGETIKQVDDRTKHKLFALYPETPWKRVIGMRNILSHGYFSIDPEIVLETVKKRLKPLLDDMHKILVDIDMGLREEELKEL